MKKTTISFIHGFILLYLLNLAPANLAATGPKVIGYLPTYRFGLIDQIEVEKLTHLNIAFAQPDRWGHLDCPGDYATIIRKVKKRNPEIKIYISLGGRLLSHDKIYWKKYMSPDYRTGFVQNIIRFVEQYRLDGVDMDLEWGNVDALYPGFTRELSDSLHANGFQLSAAFPAMKRYAVLTNEDFKVFDFINVMAYDNAGPWQPKVIRQHSTYDLAVNSISFWHDSCGVPLDKIILGMPLYGYNFKSRPVRSASYGSLVSYNRFLAFVDQDNLTFYNSIPTIIRKTKYAKDNCGGVMLWELGQDALGENSDYSLLHFVYATLLDGQNSPFLPRSEKFITYLYENELLIEVASNVKDDAYFVIEDINGGCHQVIQFSPEYKRIKVDVDKYVNGIYTISLIESGSVITSEKWVKSGIL
jgi:GH18 family chitinase